MNLEINESKKPIATKKSFAGTARQPCAYSRKRLNILNIVECQALKA
jgi:hypothetical protein